MYFFIALAFSGKTRYVQPTRRDERFEIEGAEKRGGFYEKHLCSSLISSSCHQTKPACSKVGWKKTHGYNLN